MHVRAHKDAFVVKLFAKEGSTVALGDPLLELDSLDEDKQQERIEKMQKLRVLAASEYEGAALQTSRDILQFAIEIAKATALKLQTTADVDFVQGPNSYPAVLSKREYEGAKAQQDRAEANLRKYNLTAQRFSDVNAVVQAYFDFELKQLEIQRKRLQVLAPIGGIVELRVDVNSFMESGRTLLLINPAHGHATK